MLDRLKTILGDNYTEEIDKAVSEEIGKNFVSRNDFNTKNESVKDLTQRLEEANKQIDAFKEMDIDSIKKSAEEWKEKAEKAEKDAEALHMWDKEGTTKRVTDF
ncbi:MAG: phage scaffolding protein [Clostridia bacterium]|nr:phage scaffolding protein [Clostridia bacterium]